MTKGDIYKILNITANTYNSYIENPYIMPLRRLIQLSGLFGLSPEQLLYLLLRNQAVHTKESLVHLGDLLDKHKDK